MLVLLSVTLCFNCERIGGYAFVWVTEMALKSREEHDRQKYCFEFFCLFPITPAHWHFTFALFWHLHPDANQYGRYGKTRAEEDAKGYLKEKQELERDRDGIRYTLVTLRQEKRELKEELKTASGKEMQSNTKSKCHADSSQSFLNSFWNFQYNSVALQYPENVVVKWS